MPFFPDTAGGFRLVGDPAPTWRPPQLGALGSLLAHFSLRDREPPIVSIPTGAGKTAVALAAAYLLPTPPRRILIVEPSVALREQVSDEARSLTTITAHRLHTYRYSRAECPGDEGAHLGLVIVCERRHRGRPPELNKPRALRRGTPTAGRPVRFRDRRRSAPRCRHLPGWRS